MPGSKKRTNDEMPDMSKMLESVLGSMPGMEQLPAEEKKKMKKAIKATTEKVQSMDLEGIFRDAMGSSPDSPPTPPSTQRSNSKPKKIKKKKIPKQRTPDKQYQINLSLEELYRGETNKKLTVRVERKAELTDDDRARYKEHSGEDAPENSYKYASTKIKHTISDRLEAGMMDDDIIVFENQADEAEDHITGDIIASIVQDQHVLFERENNDLWILNKKISLAQSYFGGFKFAHLDGRLIEVVPQAGEPLHAEGGLRRIPNAGMPLRNEDDDDDGVVEAEGAEDISPEEKYGDLYIQFDLELPDSMDERETMEQLFPPIVSENDPATQALIESEAAVHKKMLEKVEDPYETGNYGSDDDDDDDDEDDDSDDDDSDDDSDDDEDTEPETDGDETDGDDTGGDSEAENAADNAMRELLAEETPDLDPEAINNEMDKIKKGKRGKKT